MHIILKNKFLYFYSYKIKCSIGKNGLTSNKKEGDFKTPKGKFRFEFLLFRKDRIKKINCKLKKVVIKKNMGWCDDPESPYYNSLVKFPFKKSAERLFLNKKIYDLILVISFNRDPIIKNKGSAIFLHLSERNFRPTKGCVSIKKNDFIKILPFITKKTKILIK